MSEVAMTKSKSVVIPPGGGKHLTEASGQVVSMKLFGRETGESVTLFEQAVPAGSKNSWLHLHRDSDEIACVLEGEFTFKIGETVTTGGPGTCAFLPRNVPHAWKNSGSQPGRVVFLYTPAAAGRFVEEMVERPDDGDYKKRLAESGWEVLGPNPL
jgi:quercetin dioxygenase-like cupin family protein